MLIEHQGAKTQTVILETTYQSLKAKQGYKVEQFEMIKLIHKLKTFTQQIHSKVRPAMPRVTTKTLHASVNMLNFNVHVSTLRDRLNETACSLMAAERRFGDMCLNKARDF